MVIEEGPRNFCLKIKIFQSPYIHFAYENSNMFLHLSGSKSKENNEIREIIYQTISKYNKKGNNEKKE